MSILDYYKYYLTLHRHPKCRLLHFIGQWVTILFLLWALYTNTLYLLPLALFVIYPFAWTGHFFFEKNKPAAFSRPLWAKACDWVMLKDIFTGKLEL